MMKFWPETNELRAKNVVQNAAMAMDSYLVDAESVNYTLKVIILIVNGLF